MSWFSSNTPKPGEPMPSITDAILAMQQTPRYTPPSTNTWWRHSIGWIVVSVVCIYAIYAWLNWTPKPKVAASAPAPATTATTTTASTGDSSSASTYTTWIATWTQTAQHTVAVWWMAWTATDANATSEPAAPATTTAATTTSATTTSATTATTGNSVGATLVARDDGVATESSWCYIGDSKSENATVTRICSPVVAGDKCMSKLLYERQELCTHPALRV